MNRFRYIQSYSRWEWALFIVTLIVLCFYLFATTPAHAGDCVSNIPSGSILETAVSDCEEGVGTDDFYSMTSFEAVDGRGVDWTVTSTAVIDQKELTLESDGFPTGVYGGKVKGNTNLFTTEFEDGWHDLDGVQVKGEDGQEIVYVESLRVQNYGDGIVQVSPPNCAARGATINSNDNYLGPVYDDMYELDPLGSLTANGDRGITYKSVLAARPIAACEETLDGSNETAALIGGIYDMRYLTHEGSDEALGCDEEGYGSGFPFKMPTVSQGDIGPKLRIQDNVFIMRRIYHECFGGQIFPLLTKLVKTGAGACRGNVVIFIGPATDGSDNEDWEELMDNHGAGPDGESNDYARLQELDQQTFGTQTVPCYEVIVAEDDASECWELDGGGPLTEACVLDKDFEELGNHPLAGASSVSVNDLISAWNSANTADNE